MKITVYTKENCPGCNALKDILKKYGIVFKEENIEILINPKKLTELISEQNVYISSAPVLKIDNNYYASLTDEKGLRHDHVKEILNKSGLYS